MKMWHIFFEVGNKFFILFRGRDSQLSSVTINAPPSLEHNTFLNFAFSLNQKSKIPQPFSQTIFLPQEHPHFHITLNTRNRSLHFEHLLNNRTFLPQKTVTCITLICSLLMEHTTHQKCRLVMQD